MGGGKVKQRPRGLKVEIIRPLYNDEPDSFVAIYFSGLEAYYLCIKTAKALGIPIPEMGETIETTMRVVLSHTRRKR